MGVGQGWGPRAVAAPHATPHARPRPAPPIPPHLSLDHPLGSHREAPGEGSGWGRDRSTEAADRADREASPGHRLHRLGLAPAPAGPYYRSAYLGIVGENPECLPGDLTTAREVLQRIEIAIGRGGWTRNEWRRLHRMHAKWKARADGTDARFMVMGNRPGPIPSQDRALIEFTRIIRAMVADLDGNPVD
jgi:hypothetical protein